MRLQPSVSCGGQVLVQRRLTERQRYCARQRAGDAVRPGAIAIRHQTHRSLVFERRTQRIDLGSGQERNIAGNRDHACHTLSPQGPGGSGHRERLSLVQITLDESSAGMPSQTPHARITGDDRESAETSRLTDCREHVRDHRTEERLPFRSRQDRPQSLLRRLHRLDREDRPR